MFFESPQFGEHFCPKNSSQHQTSTACIRTCRRNRATPPLPRSPVRFLTSTPKPRAEGSSPSAPAKNREASTMLASLFFVSAHKDSATRHGCAPRSACRGASACQWHASYEPTEAAAETSPSAPAKNSATAFAVALFFVMAVGETEARGACRASPPKRRLWRMQRGGDGAAVGDWQGGPPPQTEPGTASGLAKQVQVRPSISIM